MEDEAEAWTSVCNESELNHWAQTWKSHVLHQILTQLYENAWIYLLHGNHLATT